MKRFDFNYSGRQFDRYRAFHNTLGPFVEFETGELMITRNYHQPYHRKVWKNYGIHYVSTTDPDCPDLYLDKECTQPVKKAWVTQNGQQCLVVDQEQGVACRVDGNIQPNENMHFASHVNQAAVLWTGPNRKPVPRSKISVSQPDSDIRRDLGDKLKDVKPIVVAAARVRDLKTWHDVPLTADYKWTNMSADEICADVLSSDKDMAVVAKNGFSYPRSIQTVDYLYTKKGA